MRVDLKDKVALVTGAGSGSGQAIALKLAENGADVVVNDIVEPAARAVAERIQRSGRRALAVVADVTDFDAVQAMARRAVSELGRIDILVNNAGWDVGIIPFLKGRIEDWERILAINFKGPVYCTRAVVEQMAKQKGGVIVNINSDAGRVGSFGEAVYSGAKGGVIAISKVWAREFARDGIRVNTVCPGLMDTPLLSKLKESELGAKILARVEQMQFWGLIQPEDVANAVLFFVSDAARQITGQVLSVSGGLTFHD